MGAVSWSTPAGANAKDSAAMEIATNSSPIKARMMRVRRDIRNKLVWTSATVNIENLK